MHTHVESNVRRCSFWRCLRPTFPCVYAYICTLPTPYSPALSQKARRLHTCTHTTGMDTTYSILLEELVGFAVFVVSFTQIPVPCAGRYVFYIPLILLNGPHRHTLVPVLSDRMNRGALAFARLRGQRPRPQTLRIRSILSLRTSMYVCI